MSCSEKKACECEHVTHFPPEEDGQQTTEHSYGREFEILELVETPTNFGTFRVCKECWADHFKHGLILT